MSVWKCFEDEKSLHEQEEEEDLVEGRNLRGGVDR
jgi:hypothetical protein